MLSDIEEQLTNQDTSDERRAGLQAGKAAVLDHFHHARQRDPDLASLRELPGFAGLFEEAGD